MRSLAPPPVLLLAFSLAGTELSAQPRTPDWVGFETIEQSALPILRARLNGSGPHRLVLDVSFTDFVLDTTIVAGTGLELGTGGEQATIDFYGRKEQVPVAVLEELAVGGLAFPMVRTLLVEGEDGTGVGGLRSYGRIGRDLLEGLRLTVHYPRRLLYLEPSPRGEPPPGGASFQAAGRFLLLPVVLSTEGVTEEVRFVLDAGTSNTVVDRRWAAENGFATKDASAVRIPSMRVGGFEVEGTPALLGTMRELPYAGDPVGVIGADVLLGLSVTYDFARDVVWLVTVDKGAS